MISLIYLMTLISIVTYPITTARIAGQPLAMFLAVLLVIYFVINKLHEHIDVETFWPVGLLVAGFVLSSIVAHDVNTDFLINMTVFYIIFLTFANMGKQVAIDMDPEKAAHLVLHVLVLSGILLCTYGFYGYLTGNIGTDTQMWWWSSAKYWGIHYTEATRNADIHYIAFPFVAVLAKEEKKPVDIFLLVYFGAAIILSMARNCWIATAVILFVFIAQKKDVKQAFKYMLIGAAAVILMSLVLSYFGMGDYFTKKVLSIFSNKVAVSNSNRQRWQIIKVTVDTITSHPLGIGAQGMYKYYFDRHIYLNHAENTYLNITAELGVIATIGYCYIAFKPFSGVVRELRENPGKQLGTIKTFILYASIYTMITLLFNTETLNCYFWIIYALLWFLACLEEHREGRIAV